MQKLLVASVLVAAFLVGCKGEEASTTPQSGPSAQPVSPAKKDGDSKAAATMDAQPAISNAEADAHVGGKVGK